MKVSKILGAAILAAAVGSAVPSMAHHDAGSGCGAPDQAIETPAGRFYWDDREHEVVGDGLVSGNGSWIYQEDNGNTTLQHKQGQVSIIDETDVEICTYPSGYSGKPDILIF